MSRPEAGETRSTEGRATISEFDPWRRVRQITRPRLARPLGERLSEGYITVFYLMVVVAMAGSVLHFTNAQTQPSTFLLDSVVVVSGGIPALPAICLMVMALVLIASWGLLTIGPVSASRADLVWGLQLPVDRRPFLRAAVRRILLKALLASSAVAVVVLFAGGAIVGDSATLLSACVLVAAIGPAGAAAAVVVQARSRAEGDTAAVAGIALWSGAVLLLAGAGTGLATMALGIPFPVVGGDSLAAVAIVAASALAVVAAACVGSALALRSVRGLGWPQLAASGGHHLVVRAAASSLDAQAVYRSLTRAPSRRRRASAMLRSAVSGPWTAVVAAEALSWWRIPGALSLWLSTLGLGLLLPTVSGWGAPVVLLTVVVVLGLLAADCAASATRASALSPDLEAVLPISAGSARIARLVHPCALMAVWMTVTLGVLSLLTGLPVLLAMAPLAGIGVGATATAGARQPPINWAGSMVLTELGPVPVGAINQMTAAHRSGVIVLVPVATVLLGAGGWVPLAVQAVATGAMVIWALVVQKRR